MVPKRELICVLLKTSLNLRKRLGRTIERNIPYRKLKVNFRYRWTLNTLFCFKDLLEKKIRSGIIYCYMVVTSRLLIT